MKKAVTIVICLSLFFATLILLNDASAYERYKNAGQAGTWCAACHGDFTDATSTKGSTFPSNSKHEMHRSSSAMNTECALCHTKGDNRNPFIGSSDGTANNPGLGCSGCHMGPGLRAHHAANGVTVCAGCHTNDPTPPPEDTMPPYYGTADTLANNPCNPVAEPNINENWTIGDFVGLDNDGDNLYDGNDPDCQAVETACFDGVDNDGDGLTDCADPDCEGVTDGACNTGQPGICADGTYICSGGSLVCEPNTAPQIEGPYGDPTCSDGLDNDCDGLTDADDPDCQMAMETACFDGVDNDGDGLTDCADPDCEGATDGACDTGLPGICASGTYICSGGAQICQQDQQATPEGNAYGNCEDGLDNDCDGLTDYDDPDCVMMQADVWLVKLRAPKSAKLATGGRSATKNIVVSAEADTKAQDATVTLTVAPINAVSVTITPASITQTVTPGDGADSFKFSATLSCNQAGVWTLNWTATITAPENRDTTNDTLTATTEVTCR